MRDRKEEPMIIHDGVDAVFLPGKIHGCEDEVYIIYLNAEGNNRDGCWEIEILDAERILKIHEIVGGDCNLFFAELADWFHGEWRYCNFGTEDFDELQEAYPTADFICGRDGDSYEEMMFIVNWAKSRTTEK